MMENTNFYDAIVIGGGPAGLTAGLYLARACYRVLVIEKETFGGQITITSEVVNYPGSGPISGRTLTDRMRQQAEAFDCEFLLASVEKLDFSQDVRQVVTDRGTFSCLGVILATGAHPRMVGFAGEASLKAGAFLIVRSAMGNFSRARKSLWSAADLPQRKSPYFSRNTLPM